MARSWVSDVVARLRLDAKGFKGSLNRQTSAVRRWSKQVGGEMRGVATGWLGIAAAVVVVQRAISTAISKSAEWQTAQVKMRVVAQGNIETLTEMKAIVDAEAGGLFNRADIASALNYSQAVGFNLQQAKRLIPALKDAAAVYGDDLAMAMMAVVRAAKMGEAELAERFGLTLRQNMIEKEAAELFQTKAANLNAEQKQLVVVAAALNQLSRISGAQNEATKTLAGATRLLKTEYWEFITTALEPGIEPISQTAKALGEVVTEMRSLQDAMSGMSVPAQVAADAIGKIVKEWSPLTPFFEEFEARRRQRVVQRLAGKAAFGIRFPGPPGIVAAGIEGTEAAARARSAQEDFERKYQEWFNKKFNKPVGVFEQELTRRLMAQGPSPGDVGLRGQPFVTGPPEEMARKEFDWQEIMRQGRVEGHQLMLDAITEQEQNAADARVEAWGSYGHAIEGVLSGIESTALGVSSMILKGEISTSRKMSALWGWAAKNMAASVIGGLGEQAKTKASYYFAEGLGLLATGQPGAASAFASAAKFSLLAGVAGGASAAMGASAQRELSTIRSDQDDFGGIGGAGGRTAPGRRGALTTISRMPEHMHWNFTFVIEGDAYGVSPEKVFEDFIKPAVTDGIREGSIPIPGVN